MAKTSYKKMTLRRHPGAFCVDLTDAVDQAERGYAVYNHNRINEGGYVRLGFAKTPGLAWKQASTA